ncbi:hypothetical protein HanPI659440_Chr08g0294041 [Helianthus annuus]|nr:hypothetical protein HanPI659440_Chr08g0294041 [Helianthus annuus]
MPALHCHSNRPLNPQLLKTAPKWSRHMRCTRAATRAGNFTSYYLKTESRWTSPPTKTPASVVLIDVVPRASHENPQFHQSIYKRNSVPGETLFLEKPSVHWLICDKENKLGVNRLVNLVLILQLLMIS